MNSAIKQWTRYAAIAFGVVALCFGGYALVTEPGAMKRFWLDIVERPTGPMSFRFVLQPIMAVIAAWKDGKKDAATGRSPYFWTVMTDPSRRRARLLEGLHATGRILALGLAMDLAYQALVLKHFYPWEAIVIAILLAFVPYLLLRGAFTRFFARRSTH